MLNLKSLLSTGFCKSVKLLKESPSKVKTELPLALYVMTEWDLKIEGQLISFGIKWTHSFSVYDELLRRGTKIVGEIQFPDGTIQKKFEDGAWDKIKGEYCRENNISLHIDDTLIYNEHFTTPFARLWTHNGKPKSSKKDLRHLD